MLRSVIFYIHEIKESLKQHLFYGFGMQIVIFVQKQIR